jgi:hypothetical protein
MDVSRVHCESVPVKTRSETDVELSIAFTGDLHANGTAQRDHAVIDDAVIDLYAFAALAEHTRLVEGVQVLRHVGLGGVDFGQQLTHIFFAIAQSADDAQAHRGRHDTKDLGGFFKNLLRFSQNVVFGCCSFGHGVFFGLFVMPFEGPQEQKTERMWQWVTGLSRPSNRQQ